MGILDPLMKVLNPRKLVCVLMKYTFTFSRHFYPKRRIVHSGYNFFCQYVCSLGIEPTTFVLLTQCSSTEPQEHRINSKMSICCSKNILSMLKTVVLLNIFVETLVDFLGYDE